MQIQKDLHIDCIIDYVKEFEDGRLIRVACKIRFHVTNLGSGLLKNVIHPAIETEKSYNPGMS